MAQHDYVIDNQSAPSARADINSALAAIVTQNSGASAPATTYADMFWYDTANNQLKKRNEANSAWIVLGTIDESTNKFTPNSALTTAGIDPATLVVAAEGIAANNNDTTLPTSAAVKAYTDSAVAAVPGGLGESQTWQTVTRVESTSYQNTTGKPIMVVFTITNNSSASSRTLSVSLSVNNSTWLVVGQAVSNSAASAPFSVYTVVPPNHYYRFGAGTSTTVTAVELR
jgi:hypothetical protein